MATLTIVTTATRPTERQDAWKEALRSYLDLADTVLILLGESIPSPTAQEIVETFHGEERLKFMLSPWPEEFEWSFIGQQFNRAYQAAESDWVIRSDLDYVFHEKDMVHIRNFLDFNPDIPAASFWKYQFLLVDRFQIKSRPVIAMNKKRFGTRIKLNGGGDLCQPTLDDIFLPSESVLEVKAPIWNYDFCFKDKMVIEKDFARFSRAWQKTFGEYRLGGPDQESAFAYFRNMMMGRFLGSPHESVALEDHPRYIQPVLRSLKSDKFGYEGFGWFGSRSHYYEK